ncbi:MAG: cysteine--tRNA ligase [Candidatus Dependentiae bacterium]|nr:cysteine--tRNA ligase [Candidatus Dependentiae bacterium]
MASMKLTNTMSGQKEHFEPRHDKKVTMYVCGITPYDYAHVGHGRCYITFDLVYRLLNFLGYSVTYCRNYTDIDDKILVRAAQQLGSAKQYHEITKTYINAFKEDIEKLNCISPSIEPRVTDSIDLIIEFIEKLIEAGKAYVVNGDVYYDVSTFPSYGKLSKQKLDELRAGARVDVREAKKGPLDFALWKKETDGEFWKSPWGYGRPGWHIECSAMAGHYLGEQIDIHAGGADLIFPHHENEIAQSEGRFEKQFARYWLHNGFVMINKEKMSKSLNNFFTLRDVFAQFDPMVIRFYILNHHYRAPLDFSFDDITAIQKSYQRLCKFFAQVEDKAVSTELLQKSATVERMLKFLTDDLNTSGMWGVVFESLPLLQNNQEEAQAVKAVLKQILGLSLQPLQETETNITAEIQQLIEEREQARKAKDWARADIIRDQLAALGYSVKDKKL